ncbi:MAG TPA: hypothetical protein VG826_33715 [Pirellulales bacterium]|nr:hypothetical protein [Pirellulales bacterium]
MIVFLDEERAYLYWVTHHRAGYVLDCFRKPTKNRLMLHRATCPQIKMCRGKRTHWTTGRHAKACSLDADSLKAWAMEQAQAEPECCAGCLGDASSDTPPRHLSHLDKEVLSFVLEVAMLHLDDRDATYLLTVGKTAKCLAKTPGQLGATLRRLVDDGLLELVGKVGPGNAAPVGCRLMPTVAAMRTLPCYQESSDAEIAKELSTLTSGWDERSEPR